MCLKVTVDFESIILVPKGWRNIGKKLTHQIQTLKYEFTRGNNID